MENSMDKNQTWLDKPVINAIPKVTRERLIITIVIILAILSRFIMLGSRVMSHDEVNHVVPSYNLYSGSGYVHDPVTHGPFQFHMVALSYFLFGDNDFSSRIPAALFSVAAIVFILFGFRRYLGRVGSLVAGGLFLISPFILFYGRYTRNEAFIELFAVLTFYGILRYYEKRDNFSLYLLATVTALQFVTKETSYLYTATALLFFGFLFLAEIWKTLKAESEKRNRIFLLLIITLLFILLGASCFILTPQSDSTRSALTIIGYGFFILGVAVLALDIVLAMRTIPRGFFKDSPSFNLIVLIGALILPQLTALPVKLLGFDPLDYSTTGMIPTGIVLVILFAISFVIGLWWNRKVFLRSAVAFYVIYIFFYTTVFSNGQGFFTGIVGSLGYWLSQQGVQRGGQPGYYYAAILLPVYEFASIAGTILAAYFGIKWRRLWSIPGDTLSYVEIKKSEPIAEEFPQENSTIGCDTRNIWDGKSPVLLLFLFWSVISLIAYSIAGEKMPWLSVHIAMPLALSAAWGIGWLLETAPWEKIISWNGLISTIALIVDIAAFAKIANSLNQTNLPFSGKDTATLKTTYAFIFALIVFVAMTIILIRIWQTWRSVEKLKSFTLLVISVLIILQARTAFQASFINYNNANELLVYAHAAPGPKIVLKQIEDIADKTGQGKNIRVAYDNDALYPYWWYLRDYPNKYYFGEENPTRTLRDYDIIIANTSKEGRLEPIVQDGYYRYEYTRLWWPNQDYWNLTPQRIIDAFSNPNIRAGLFDIWLNRDYTRYAAATGKTTLTAETWEPSAKMVVYIKKDVLRQIWTLSDENSFSTESQTYYNDDEKFVEINPVLSFGSAGTGDGQFTQPRNLAIADDGTIYVLDSGNNRVEYFSGNGTYLGQWNASEAGGMNQPWGIAVGTDGSVFVADTWNHRILKFSSEGQVLKQWYATDTPGETLSFYGPRDIAISNDGKVFISDTGNKRIMVYDEDGNYISKFGVSGMGTGEFDEQVGIAVSSDHQMAIADTWNQRIQIFNINTETLSFTFQNSFDVSAWYSQSLDNKPYIAYTKDGNILISDPESYRIMEFNSTGTLLRSWNAKGGSIDDYSMPTGVKVDKNGAVWVVDTVNSQINKFILPPLEEAK